jgi:hypothetical protein
MEDLKWRTAAIVVTVVAALEFVALAGGAVVVFGNPLASHLGAPAAKAASRIHKTTRPRPVAKPTLTRSQTVVMVLNGNGVNGAAAAAAAQVRSHGYRIGRVGNAARSDYTRTIVMYKPGYAGEGARLAHDLHAGIVSPLDGMLPSQLRRSQVVLIVGA